MRSLLDSSSNLTFNISGKLRFPSITICKQFLFIIEKFFMCHCCVLKIRTLDNCINRTGSLAKSTIDTFSHINIVLGSSSRTIRSGLTLNCDSLGRTGWCAEFACNTSKIYQKSTFLLQLHIFLKRVLLWTLEKVVPFHRGSELSILAQIRKELSRTKLDRKIKDWSTEIIIICTWK